jgi:hypothetical protein
MKKKLFCLLSIIAIIAIIIPSGSALAFDSKTINRLYNESANASWMTPTGDPDGPGGIPPTGFITYNLNVNKGTDGTNVNLNLSYYNFWPPPQQGQWPNPDKTENGGIYTQEDIFSLMLDKKVITAATLSSVTLTLSSNWASSRQVTFEADWTACGIQGFDKSSGRTVSGDTVRTYSYTSTAVAARGNLIAISGNLPSIPAPPIVTNTNGKLGILSGTETITNK